MDLHRGAVCWVSLGISVLSFIVTARVIVRRRRDHCQPYRNWYEDKDGQSTAEAVRAFSNTRPKVFLVIFCISGFVLSASLSLSNRGGNVDGSHNWLDTAPWLFFVIQALCIAACRDSVTAYNGAAYLGFSLIAYSFCLLVNTNDAASYLVRPPGTWTVVEVIRGFSTLGAIISCLSLPRRPHVYLNGHKVDDMYSATMLSRMTWSWAWGLPMFVLKLPKIDFEDMPYLPHWVRAKVLAHSWGSFKDQTSLAWALARFYRKELAVQWILGALKGCATFGIYYTTLKLLQSLEAMQRDALIPGNIWALVIWLCVAILGGEWLENYVHWLGWGELNNRVRAQISAIMIDKLMRRKNVTSALNPITNTRNTTNVRMPNVDTAFQEAESGDVIKSRKAIQHLFGVDASGIADFAGRQELIVLTVGKLVVSILFLVKLIGWVSLGAGLLSWATLLPLAMWSARKFSSAQQRWVKARDHKQTVLSESINGIRQVKFSALEAEWERRITEVRELELKSLWRLSLANTANSAFWVAGPISLAAVSLAVYALIHGGLLPSTTFVSITAFRGLEDAVMNVSDLVLDFIKFSISVVRVQRYLHSPELGMVVTENDEGRLAFCRATIAWPVDVYTDAGPYRFALADIDIEFPIGELTIILGKTGSGKTLLLHGLIGEIDLLCGSIMAPRPPLASERRDDKVNTENWILSGSKAFVSQNPWIEDTTVKDNILFGLPMNLERYAQTLEACALTKDIELLPDGDETELGINGVNLSGGQRWRVSLARAIYSRAGILVMDDIFSAVDAHVGRHLFENCINGPLCRGRTMVLVTHHVKLCLPKARLIVELDDGKVKSQKTSAAVHEDETVINSDDGGESIATEMDTMVSEELNASTSGREVADNFKQTGVTKARRKFIEKEARREGAVSATVYYTYLKAVGKRWYIWWAFVFINFIAFQLAMMGRSWWLKVWTGGNQKHTETSRMPLTVNEGVFDYIGAPAQILNVTKRDSDLYFYLAMYLFISLIGVVATALRFLYLFVVSIRSGRVLFKKLTQTVLHAPLLWLDTTPAARILNRFVVDSVAVDRQLILEFNKFTTRTFSLVGICVAAWLVSPYFIILAAACVAICLALSRHHIITKRPVKRLEAVARSTIFGHFASGLSGITTIRAYDRTATYIEASYKTIDVYISTSWHLHINNHWMGFSMGVVGTAFTAVVAIFVLLNHVDAALAGFALSFAVDFSAAAMWIVRTFVALENNMTAMERVVEYSAIETEPQGGDSPPAAWPTDGRIEVNDLVVSYASDLPPVLKGVTFSIRGGERIGVVGRTGAGKSSLTLAMFRLIEASSGTVHIDGLDISKLRLHDLRSRLTIIPQDPLLFSGTIRSNLDPFGVQSDDVLYDSLRRVNLIKEGEPTDVQQIVSGTAAVAGSQQSPTNIFEDLSSLVSDGGANLSHGQRQLLCLARAIVERPRIMLLDEATSAVDMATDNYIQRSIRDEFSHCTLIVIAHRLSTVADFDRILVLDEGRVAEFGSPMELWDSDGGLFRALCERSGERDDLERVICSHRRLT